MNNNSHDNATTRRRCAARPQPSARDSYVAEFSRVLAEQLRGRRVGHISVDDVVQSEVVRLLANFEHFVNRYPSATRLATLRACTGHSIADHIRRDGVQRGSGAVVRRNEYGTLVKGRIVISGDAPVTHQQYDTAAASTVFDHYAADTASFDESVEQFDVCQLLEAALLHTTPRQRTLLYLVEGVGFSVTQAAAAEEISRETASRDLSAARRRIPLPPV